MSGKIKVKKVFAQFVLTRRGNGMGGIQPGNSSMLLKSSSPFQVCPWFRIYTYHQHLHYEIVLSEQKGNILARDSFENK